MLSSLAALTLSLALSLPSQAATICNGHSELCDRLYSNVTFLGAHDSYAVGSSIADNQSKNVTEQLDDGIRTLQIQTHNATDGIHLCHTSCDLLDGGTLENYLSSVASWVAANPNDVITLVIVNIDDLPPTSFTSAFTSSGLQRYTYSPSAAEISLRDWPSLGTLIDSGKTVVVFMDQEADFTSVPWIIDEFSNIFEDAFDVTEQSFACAVNRTAGSPSSQMMLINHFLDSVYNFGGASFFVPNRALVNETNSATGVGSIGSHVDNCLQVWGRNPNHILLDFYDSNGIVPFNLVASLNGVSQPTNTITPDPVSATTTSGTGTAVVSTSPLSGGATSETRRSLGVMLGVVLGGIVLGMSVMGI